MISDIFSKLFSMNAAEATVFAALVALTVPLLIFAWRYLAERSHRKRMHIALLKALGIELSTLIGFSKDEPPDIRGEVEKCDGLNRTPDLRNRDLPRTPILEDPHLWIPWLLPTEIALLSTIRLQFRLTKEHLEKIQNPDLKKTMVNRARTLENVGRELKQKCENMLNHCDWHEEKDFWIFRRYRDISWPPQE